MPATSRSVISTATASSTLSSGPRTARSPCSLAIAPAAVLSPTGMTVARAELGDLTGDGKPDLVAIGNSGSILAALYNPGDGSFQDSQALPAGSNPGVVVSGDWNGDGKTDLAVASF